MKTGTNRNRFNLKLQKKRLLKELEQLNSSCNLDKKEERDVSFQSRIEIADATTEFEKNLALDAFKRTNQSRIELALKKIDDGTYGICDYCGNSIDPARLEILPYANVCINCCRNDSLPEKVKKD